MDIRTVKKLLKSHNLKPSKRLGQNFLVNESALRKVVEATDISKKDCILEIGPGLGSLTILLAEQAKGVVAVEKDEKLCDVLAEVLKDRGISNVKVIRTDILKLGNKELAKVLPAKYKIAANIPYYLTSFLIRKLLESTRKPELIVLTVQKEVAQRICSKPPKMNLLAVSVQFYGKPKIFSYINKSSFWPRPKIDSAVLKIIPKRQIKTDAGSFFKVVRAGFSHPRKQIINNLSDKLKIDKGKTEKLLLACGIQPSRRAESLNLNDWQRLAKNIK